MATREITVKYKVEFSATFELDKDDCVDDAISNIDIPEGGKHKSQYQEDSFEVTSIEKRNLAMTAEKQTVESNHSFTSEESQKLRELKIELYRKLLAMPISLLTDNEVDIQLVLSRDSAIQDELKAGL